MSRIYYTVEENGNIAFHKKNPLICREKIIDPADAPTKEAIAKSDKSTLFFMF